MNPIGTVFEIDDFQQHARSVLKGPGAERKVQALLTLRRTLNHRVETLHRESTPSASDLNRLYSSMLLEAAHVLGDEDFKHVFGEAPQPHMNIVDPAVKIVAEPTQP